jgi:hypothetical protein
MATAMTKEEVLKRLEHLRMVQEENIRSNKRKRSWRESEKAMAMVEFQLRLQALDYAINAINK